MSRFNDWLALRITRGVATMTCAWLFAGLAFISFPSALHSGTQGLISWISQAFLQLVLLSVIMVGGRLQDERHEDRHADLKAHVDAHMEVVHGKLDRM